MVTRRLTAWVMSLALVLSGLSVAAASDATISASVAGLFVGEEKIVEGTVSSAQREGNVVRLRLGTAPQALTVSLVIGLLSDFPPAPERAYLSQTVRVAGTIRDFRGAPEIVIHDAADIRIVGAAPLPVSAPPAAVKAGPVEEPSLRERLDTLSERVRVLEERVRRLERSGQRSEE